MALLKFEHKAKGLATTREFASRVAFNAAAVAVILALSLGLGTFGYHEFEGFDIVDSFANAAMILSGMGPVDTLPTEGSKVFAGIYALYCGFAVLAVAGLIFSPLVHRLLHRFHADDDSPSVPPTIPGPVRKR